MTDYVAWGVDFDDPTVAGYKGYWVAAADDDNEPLTAETHHATADEARETAEALAKTMGLDAYEVDEFGAKTERGGS